MVYIVLIAFAFISYGSYGIGNALGREAGWNLARRLPRVHKYPRRFL